MPKDITWSRNKSRGTKDLIDWTEVGQRIRQLRGFNMTQEQLSVRIGVSQGHLSYMERGEKEIGAEILLRICREFGKSLEWLLVGKED
jgi:transcriptional regulator with XRE-family HTH domain